MQNGWFDVETARIPAVTPPIIWRPSVNPTTISLSAGQKATISYKLSSACSTLVEIITDSNVTPGITSVRTLQNWSAAPAGTSSVQWDGTDNNGLPVTPGTYVARVQARYKAGTVTNFATAWVSVAS